MVLELREVAVGGVVFVPPLVYFRGVSFFAGGFLSPALGETLQLVRAIVKFDCSRAQVWVNRVCLI